MDKIVEIINTIVGFIEGKDFTIEMLDSISEVTVPINWSKVLRVNVVLLLALFLAGLLFIVTDSVTDRLINRRIKQHKLTITNNGNTASLFLLRTVDLPKSLAIRFRTGGMPLIRVTYEPKKTVTEVPAVVEVSAVDNVAQRPDPDDHIQTLIPDLSDPMQKKKDSVTPQDAVNSVTKSINDVGKKAGFFASILSNISTLLPNKVSGLQEAQASLKSIQQKTTEVTSSIGTKVNTVDSLGSQLGQLAGADKVASAAKSVAPMANQKMSAVMQAAGGFDSNQFDSNEPLDIDQPREDYINDKNFVYDEEVWNRNIGKVDELGGSLNFFQSKILKPGESMKIDVEIMNLSESSAAVSHLYKIEVLQIPQTKMQFRVPSHYVNGIVIYEKLSQFERILPQLVVFGLVIVSIQIIAGVSYLLF